MPTAARRKPVDPARRAGALQNRVLPADRPVHEWYRFVLSYPPHLVRDVLRVMDLPPSATVLDPFCGTGTTLVECKKLGMRSIGLEANPMAAFASRVKTIWGISPRALVDLSTQVAADASRTLAVQGLDEEPADIDDPAALRLQSLPPAAARLLLRGSISPLPLHRVLVLQQALARRSRSRAFDHLRLALARTVVHHASNLHFGPEVGVRPPRVDAPVISPWLSEVSVMASDLDLVRDRATVPSSVHQADARSPLAALAPGSIDAVVTSPPYPNEKDYTRTTRLEAVILGFLSDMPDVRALKQSLVRSNTRSVYVSDDDHTLVRGHTEIERIASAIESRRIQLGKTSGFERLYHRVTRLYFGGMMRHLAELRRALRPGARLAYVVGDQASYLRIMIRTGQLLADIAQRLGYEVVGIELFRTRLATATREQLREEIVLLRWPGTGRRAPASRTRRVSGGA